MDFGRKSGARLKKGGEERQEAGENQELNINFLKEIYYVQENDKFVKFCFGA